MMIMTKKKDNIEYMEQHALSTVMALIFQKAVDTHDLKDFTFLFLNSDLFPQYFINHTIFSQSPLYILSLFQEELDKKGLLYSIPKRYQEDDIAYWMGYLFAEWYQEYHFQPKTFTEEQFDWLFQQYEVLHTQSIKYVAEIFLERFPE